jgi:hypothetical protein
MALQTATALERRIEPSRRREMNAMSRASAISRPFSFVFPPHFQL